MTYLRVRNFAKHQHYKSKPGYGWVKFYVKTLEDEELRALPVATRLLFDMLLLLACRYGNAIPNDSKRIGNQLGMTTQQVSKGLEQLLEGGWLSETHSSRKSRLQSRQTLRQIREDKKDLGLPRGVAAKPPDRVLTAWHDTDGLEPLAPLMAVPRLPETETA